MKKGVSARHARWPGLPLILLSLFAFMSVPAIASPVGSPASNPQLVVAAVHASYALTQTPSATVTSTVTPTVRWDLVKVVQQTVLAGGHDVGKDAARSETIRLSGSGDARPGAHNAAGGGTYTMHHRERHHDGPHDEEHWTETEERGIYVVTGFVDWTPAGGALTVNDGIGRSAEASAGILTLNVRLYPAAGGHQDGVLTINAHLPGDTPPIEQGIMLAVDGFFFVQDTGAALFHIQP